MKVKSLIEALHKMDEEQEVCVLLYTKNMFDYNADDEVELTVDTWNKICHDFDEVPFKDIWEFISTSVSEEATEKEFS